MQTTTFPPPLAPPLDAEVLADPVDPLAETAGEEDSTLGLVELLLKNPQRVDALTRDAGRQATLITRFLAVALAGYIIFGVTAAVVLNAASTWPAWVPRARWTDGTALNLIVAYCFGLIAANGVCLPSFYFYGLLAGVRVSMLEVTAHALKGMAAGAIALIGILPIYVALVLGMIVLNAPTFLMHVSLYLMLVLPFIGGLWGVRSLYTGFVACADTMRPERREVRACFLRRLVLSWSACYSAVTPVMIYSIWHALSGLPLR